MEQVEFAKLFARLKEKGVRAVDLAAELKMTPASVSMTLKGERNPRPLTLDALRAMVDRMFPEAVRPQQMRERPAETDEELWRRRAFTAEKELHDLKNKLRELTK